MTETTTHGLAAGTRLVNKHTDQPATVVQVDNECDPPRVTIDWNQAKGPARDVGATVDSILENWRVV
jgi:hypothetical protein